MKEKKKTLFAYQRERPIVIVVVPTHERKWPIVVVVHGGDMAACK